MFGDWDYPRVCGGTSIASAMAALTAGLSPRVRGNRRRGRASLGRRRTIPACAGEPPCASKWAIMGWDYPRVCGGTGNSTS